MIFVLNLPDGQVMFFGKFKLQKDCIQSCYRASWNDLWASTRYLQLMPEWQAVKLTFFAPCMRISKSPGMIFKIRKLNLAAKLQCLQENNPSCDHPEAMELWWGRLQIFWTPSLNFGDSWENFGGWKTSFALEMAPCWQNFFAKQTKLCSVRTGPKLFKPYFLFRGI